LGFLIEGQRFGRFQIGLIFWICAFMLIEGYDMQVVGYAAPAIIKAWHSDKAAFGVVFSAGLAVSCSAPRSLATSATASAASA
jgi:MFS transporter, AAHS family, 4-hydroxybenzoate transporter